MGSPLPDDARTELDRIAGFWARLPLDQAQLAAGWVRDLAQAFADEAAETTGAPRGLLPDLGAGVVIDQLRVCAYDAAAAGIAVTDRLERLRRELP